MKLPGFIQTDTNGGGTTDSGAQWVTQGEQQRVIPTLRDNQQEAYRECLVDCRLSRGRNCPTLCSKVTTANIGYGVSPGTSTATEICCIAKFFGCVAANLDNPIGLIGCGADSYDCADRSPCNTAG
jgi:hypothetical protein